MYDFYKYGGLAVFDDVDGSESKALLELNKMISGSGYEPYLFPNEELVIPSPNFRVLSSANTWGEGGDSRYPTREKMDYSTMGRFAQIYYGFDPRIEKAILSKYPEVYDFCIAFRNALEERKAEYILSTADMGRIKEMLESKICTWQEIMEIVILKNKRFDTLQAVKGLLKQEISGNPVYDHYVKAFEEYSKVRKL